MSDAIGSFVSYLTKAGVMEHWAWTAAGWMRDAMTENSFFCTSPRKPSVTVSNLHYAARFAITADAHFPDKDKAATMRLVYTFDPNRKMAHKVTRKLVT